MKYLYLLSVLVLNLVTTAGASEQENLPGSSVTATSTVVEVVPDGVAKELMGETDNEDPQLKKLREDFKNAPSDTESLASQDEAAQVATSQEISFYPLARYQFGDTYDLRTAISDAIPFGSSFDEYTDLAKTLSLKNMWGYALELTLHQSIADYQRRLTHNYKHEQAVLYTTFADKLNKSVPNICYALIQTAEGYTPPPAN